MEDIKSIEVPPNIMIDSLRNEVARLNDQRIQFVTTIEWQNQVIEALKHQLEHAENVSHEHPEETTQEHSE
jgi:hypothetical protein